MRRKLLIVALAAAFASIAALGSLAYFTSSGSARNVITAGNIRIELIEEDEDAGPFPNQGITGVMPGTETVKRVYVKNTGDNDAWIRLSVETLIELNPAYAKPGLDADAGLVSFDMDEENWLYLDGYYYFKSALPEGESTSPLFTAVTFSPDMGNAYMECTVNVDITAEAVQAANNGNVVTEAAGWPAP